MSNIRVETASAGYTVHICQGNLSKYQRGIYRIVSLPRPEPTNDVTLPVGADRSVTRESRQDLLVP